MSCVANELKEGTTTMFKQIEGLGKRPAHYKVGVREIKIKADNGAVYNFDKSMSKEYVAFRSGVFGKSITKTVVDGVGGEMTSAFVEEFKLMMLYVLAVKPDQFRELIANVRNQREGYLTMYDFYTALLGLGADAFYFRFNLWGQRWATLFEDTELSISDSNPRVLSRAGRKMGIPYAGRPRHLSIHHLFNLRERHVLRSAYWSTIGTGKLLGYSIDKASIMEMAWKPLTMGNTNPNYPVYRTKIESLLDNAEKHTPRILRRVSTVESQALKEKGWESAWFEGISPNRKNNYCQYIPSCLDEYRSVQRLRHSIVDLTDNMISFYKTDSHAPETHVLFDYSHLYFNLGKQLFKRPEYGHNELIRPSKWKDTLKGVDHKTVDKIYTAVESVGGFVMPCPWHEDEILASAIDFLSANKPWLDLFYRRETLGKRDREVFNIKHDELLQSQAYYSELNVAYEDEDYFSESLAEPIYSRYCNFFNASKVPMLLGTSPIVAKRREVWALLARSVEHFTRYMLSNTSKLLNNLHNLPQLLQGLVTTISATEKLTQLNNISILRRLLDGVQSQEERDSEGLQKRIEECESRTFLEGRSIREALAYARENLAYYEGTGLASAGC